MQRRRCSVFSDDTVQFQTAQVSNESAIFIYDYKDGHRVSDEPVGYKYEVALPDKHLEKLAVRIDGACQMEEPESFCEVVFEGLQLSLYWTPSGHQIKATASKIRPAAAK